MFESFLGDRVLSYKFLIELNQFRSPDHQLKEWLYGRAEV